jgi:hypothetical protein
MIETNARYIRPLIHMQHVYKLVLVVTEWVRSMFPSPTRLCFPLFKLAAQSYSQYAYIYVTSLIGHYE